MSLKTFVDQKNRVRRMMGMPEYVLASISEKDAQELFKQIDSAMSPEALYQDGERSQKEANAMAKMYKAAWIELLAKGFKPVEPVFNMA